jgi:hypothetical protein
MIRQPPSLRGSRFTTLLERLKDNETKSLGNASRISRSEGKSCRRGNMRAKSQRTSRFKAKSFSNRSRLRSGPSRIFLKRLITQIKALLRPRKNQRAPSCSKRIDSLRIRLGWSVRVISLNSRSLRSQTYLELSKAKNSKAKNLSSHLRISFKIR